MLRKSGLAGDMVDDGEKDADDEDEDDEDEEEDDEDEDEDEEDENVFKGKNMTNEEKEGLESEVGDDGTYADIGKANGLLHHDGDFGLEPAFDDPERKTQPKAKKLVFDIFFCFIVWIIPR